MPDRIAEEAHVIRLILLFIFTLSALSVATSEAGDAGEVEPVEAKAKIAVEVVSVSPGFESVPKFSAVLKMTNADDTACEVRRYVLIWDGGEKEIAVSAPFVIKAGETVERRAQLTDGPLGMPVTEAEATRRVATLRVEVACD